MVETEYWHAKCEDGSVVRITVRLEVGKRLRAEWQLPRGTCPAAYVDSPLVTSANMAPELRERAIRALLSLCKGPLKEQGITVFGFQRCTA